MINSVILIGRLTRDVEVQKTNNGKSVASFSLAVDNYYGTGQKSCSFIPCTAWGPIAENLAKYCGKGSQICVEGRLQQRSYQTKDGGKNSVVEVICSQVEFLERRTGESSGDYVDQEYSDSVSLDSTDNGDLPF